MKRTTGLPAGMFLGDLGDTEADSEIFHFCTSSSVGGFGTSGISSRLAY
jgi:hypothetical protein